MTGTDDGCLGLWPTPLQAAEAAAAVYVKREDLCGFAFGGSKVRALEPVLGEVRGRGAWSIVTGGRRDSNWVALIAAAAAAVRGLAGLVRDRQLSRTDPDSALRRLSLREQAGAFSRAADLAAASCGVLLDPVFAGPAWHTACAGRRDYGRPTVLVASGGLPAYFDALDATR